jgi:DNA-binding transcriptional MerR regulator
MEVNSMPQYTTGDIAKLCDVSVRTVQFYDTKGILKPSALTEGGRRLYSDRDLKELRLICLLKSIGLSLDSIKGILKDKVPGRVLLILLDEQLKQIDLGIGEMQKQKQSIEVIKETIRNNETISVNSINGIEQIMKGKKNLKKVHSFMLAIGILMDIIQIAAILLWIFKGVWLPFVICIPIVIALGCIMTGMYHKKTAYICPECNEKFRPTLKELMFAKHTPKTRKLKCAKCGYVGYCVETYAGEETDN